MFNAPDPVSDFLAREQDALAGLDEFAPQPQEPQSNGVAEPVQNGVEPAQNSIHYNHEDSGVDLSALEINDSPAASSLQNGRGSSPAISMNFGRASSVTFEKEEPEKIKKWRENQKKMIEEKDKAEETKKDELREQAKKELEEWHTQRKKRLEQRKKDNRERESHHFNGNGTADGANVWERIAKVVGESKPNRNSAKDTSRMKGLYSQYGEVPPPPSA